MLDLHSHHPASFPIPCKSVRTTTSSLLFGNVRSACLHFTSQILLLLCACTATIHGVHYYHPWCALFYLREIDTCVKLGCTITVSPKWSFGFRAFGIEMIDLEESLGCEDVQIQNLVNQRDHGLLHCPNVGKFMSCLTPYRCDLHTCLASVLSIL
jgi:hypothetical protein